jgi:excisionase family DNA binding protein
MGIQDNSAIAYMSAPPDRLLTVRETAHRLSISESFLRHQIMRGNVPFVLRIGRAVRIDPVRLETYIQDQQSLKCPK